MHMLEYLCDPSVSFITSAKGGGHVTASVYLFVSKIIRIVMNGFSRNRFQQRDKCLHFSDVLDSVGTLAFARPRTNDQAALWGSAPSHCFSTCV